MNEYIALQYKVNFSAHELAAEIQNILQSMQDKLQEKKAGNSFPMHCRISPDILTMQIQVYCNSELLDLFGLGVTDDLLFKLGFYEASFYKIGSLAWEYAAHCLKECEMKDRSFILPDGYKFIGGLIMKQ